MASKKSGEIPRISLPARHAHPPGFSLALLEPSIRLSRLLAAEHIREEAAAAMLPPPPFPIAAIRAREGGAPLEILQICEILHAAGARYCLGLERGILLAVGDARFASSLRKAPQPFPGVECLSLGTASACQEIRGWMRLARQIEDGFFYGRLCECTDITPDAAKAIHAAVLDALAYPDQLKEKIEKKLHVWANTRFPYPDQLKNLCLSLLFQAEHLYQSGAAVQCTAYARCATLAELHRLFLKDIQRISNAISQCAIHLAIRLTRKQFAQPLTRAKTADAVGLSPSYFSRLFREKTGQCYMDFLTDIRVREATRLLRTTQLKVYEVGERVGIGNYRHFAVVYKRCTGSSPREVRAQSGMLP